MRVNIFVTCDKKYSLKYIFPWKANLNIQTQISFRGRLILNFQTQTLNIQTQTSQTLQINRDNHKLIVWSPQTNRDQPQTKRVVRCN